MVEGVGGDDLGAGPRGLGSVSDQPPKGERLAAQKLVIGVGDHVLVGHVLDRITGLEKVGGNQKGPETGPLKVCTRLDLPMPAY